MDKFGRIALVIVVLASVAIIVFVGPCTPITRGPGQTGNTTTAPRRVLKVFTTSELRKYNGKNGQPAYVAVDGLVYDVTGSRFFVNGVHSVCEEDSTAGQDLSEEMAEAPKGMREMLVRFPIVGTMAGSHAKVPVQTTPQNVPQKTFTKAELAKYNGLKGQPAYVGADGLVYDVTGSPWWTSGKHSVCNLSSMAGKDLTQALNQLPPNMRMLLQRFPVVGKLQ
jgi:predicted heme/steroid binding protein